jgi:hypothetical protein
MSSSSMTTDRRRYAHLGSLIGRKPSSPLEGLFPAEVLENPVDFTGHLCDRAPTALATPWCGTWTAFETSAR